MEKPSFVLSQDRALWKFIVFSIITLGIYSIVFYSRCRRDLNVICSNLDGKPSMSYWLLILIVGPLTAGIAIIVWFHRISARMGRELNRRQIAYSFGASDYWLWNVLGSFIVVGPFIYIHRMCKAMNLLCEDFNKKGC